MNDNEYIHHDPMVMLKGLVHLASHEKLEMAMFVLFDLMADSRVPPMDYCDIQEVLVQMLILDSLHINFQEDQDDLVSRFREQLGLDDEDDEDDEYDEDDDE